MVGELSGYATSWHSITWAEFRTTFRAHYIPEGVMAMKLDESLALKQGDQTVMQYVGRFNHCHNMHQNMSILMLRRRGGL